MSDTTSINDQILDALKALTKGGGKEADEFTSALARQSLSQAVLMAVQNAVAAQQRNYLLRQAVTTSVVRQAMAAPPEEALKIIEPHLAGDDIAETIRQLKTPLDEFEAEA